MATYFISDLHLSGDRPDIIAEFRKFLRTLSIQTEALYILGDLFEVWIGDDAIPHDMEPIISDLATLPTQGIPVFVMVGNRDFLLGTGFEKLTGATLISDPTIIDLYGAPTLLMHGDTLCTDDVDYQQFRDMVRNPHWQSDFLAKSVEERTAISINARKVSMQRTREKPDDIMDVNQNAVEETFRKFEIKQIIHGHTHRPAIHEFLIDKNPVRRIVLGDWYNQASTLRFDVDGYELSPT